MRRYTNDEKRAHVEQFLDSGLTRYQYAELHGIPVSTLMRWVDNGVKERPPHPKRLAFFNLLAEGLSPYKAGLVLGLWKNTWRYWLKQ